MHPPLSIRFFNTSIHSFHFFGATGYFLGLILGVWLADVTNLAIWPVVLCALTGAGVLFGLTWLYKAVTGREDLVYYQHEIAIMVCCMILLMLLQQPVLKYLDITLMGIGVFLLFGRIGCFSVGCCHGRIGKWGVIYTDKHVAEGFHKHFAGIPIFPIQLVESGCVLATVFIGCYAIIGGYLPGTALLLYTVIYGAVRFILEYYRGDTERPYWKGFSEAQWTTCGIFAASVILSLLGLLPHYSWHWWALPTLTIGMLATIVLRRFQYMSRYKILHPKHILEIAQGIETLQNVAPANGQITMAETSIGLNISTGVLEIENGYAAHYTISVTANTMESRKKQAFKVDYRSATEFAKLVQTLKHPALQFNIIEAKPGIYHIVFPGYAYKNNNQRSDGQSTTLSLRRSLRQIYN
jgi:hypothetical protein